MSQRVVFIAFTGGIAGKGTPVAASAAGTTGEILVEVSQQAKALGYDVRCVVMEPGFASTAAVASALGFLRDHTSVQSRIIVYGYSRGGDAAVDLARTLASDGKTIDLLVTVDAAYGPASDRLYLGKPYGLPPTEIEMVDRKIPSSVSVNLNYYQREPSGPSSLSAPGKASGSGSSDDGRSSASNSGRSDSVGSHGAPNVAFSAHNTRVYNSEIAKTTHKDIDERTKNAVILQITTFLRTKTSGRRWTPLPVATAGL